MSTAPPSGASPASPETVALLAEADKLFAQAKALRGKDDEEAANLFSQALNIRVEFYGAKALEVADSYLAYGIALYDQAIAASEVLGKEVQEKVEPAAGAATVGAVAPAAAGAASGAATASRAVTEAPTNTEAQNSEGDEAEGKSEAADDEGSSGEGGDDGGDDDGSDDSEEAVDDMNLAWQTLELARIIYEENGGPAAHPSALADVHMTLGDINCELETFAAAITEYQQALEALALLPVKSPRRVAHAHFRMSLALQFNQQIQAALDKCREAIAALQLARAEVEESVEAPPSSDAAASCTAEEAAATAARMEAADLAIADLDAIMEDMVDKEQELLAVLAAEKDMAGMLRGLLASGLVGSRAAASTSADPSAAPSAGPFSRPTGRLAPSAAAPLGGAAAPVVRDMGTAGRGRSRIILQPLPAATNGGGTGGTALRAGVTGEASAGPPKRSLADLMGGGGVPLGAFGAQAGAPLEAKRAKQAADDPAATSAATKGAENV